MHPITQYYFEKRAIDYPLVADYDLKETIENIVRNDFNVSKLKQKIEQPTRFPSSIYSAFRQSYEKQKERDTFDKIKDLGSSAKEDMFKAIKHDVESVGWAALPAAGGLGAAGLLSLIRKARGR